MCVCLPWIKYKARLTNQGQLLLPVMNKTGVGMRAVMWQHTEHQSGRCVLCRVGDHCSAWLPAHLPLSRHPARLGKIASNSLGSLPQQEEIGKLSLKVTGHRRQKAKGLEASAVSVSYGWRFIILR